jgi:prophage regulatory protein
MAILRIKQVNAKAGHKSNSTIYGAVRLGLFTRPIRIGERAVGWPDYECDAIVNARIQGKSKDQIKALVIKLHSNRATAGEQVGAV